VTHTFLLQLISFDDRFEFLVGVTQAWRRGSVIDRHRRLVGHGALDVVDADVIAEDHARIAVRLLDRCAGEADERHVGSESGRFRASPSSKSYWVRCASSAMTRTLRRFDNSRAFPLATLRPRLLKVSESILISKANTFETKQRADSAQQPSVRR
jgi:hypothetical protein